MKIVRRLSDNIVIYMFPDGNQISLSASGMVGDAIAHDMKPDTHEIIENVTKPELQFYGGCMTYIAGVWAVALEDIYFFAAHGMTQAAFQKTEAVDALKTKTQLQLGAISAFEASVKVIKDAYTQAERDTWDQQILEAVAYQDNLLAPTPLLDAMLMTKPLQTKVGLVTAIMTNRAAYSALVGSALGTMQTTLDTIEAEYAP